MAQKVTPDSVPENFTVKLALMDALPVLLFGINGMLAGQRINSPLFIIGAVLCLLSGAGKVLWKLIVVLRRKNIWPLFVQMRINMPAGFLMMLIAALLLRNQIQWALLLGMPAVLFFGLGILGMILMCVFAVRLNNADVRSNWVEQLTNAASQLFFLIGLLLL